MLNWNRGLIQEGGCSKRWRRVQKSLDALYLHFQTFIYSERAQSWTKYISVSNAFCLTAPSFVSETEACRMFKQLLCFFCRKYPPLDPTMNHCISLEWLLFPTSRWICMGCSSCIAAPCQLVAGVAGLPDGLAMGCPMVGW